VIKMNYMRQKHREMQKEFLKLSPAQRVERMDELFIEGLALYAYQRGVPLDEAYKEISKRGRFFTEDVRQREEL